MGDFLTYTDAIVTVTTNLDYNFEVINDFS